MQVQQSIKHEMFDVNRWNKMYETDNKILYNESKWTVYVI